MSSFRPFPRLRGIVLLAASVAAAGCNDWTAPFQIQPVASVTISPSVATVAVGGADTLIAVLHDEADGVLLGRTVTWSSSDETAVTVNNGIVTGVAEGSATVTAVSEGKQGTAAVNVTTDGGGGGGGGGGTPAGLAVSIATYLGGSDFEHARDVTTDAAGNIYVVGGTMSPNFPTTAGALQRVHNPGTPSQSGINPMDAFVVKLSPAGQIVWSTLLGGPNYDRAYAVEVDAQGNVFVAGRAGAGFPVTAGAFQTTFHGGQEATFYGPQDGFVCKLNASGASAAYCSYFGTSDPQIVRDIAIDAQGNAYLASSARQAGLPTGWFANAFQRSGKGGVDGVIAKINPTGTQVLWATYLGGSGDEGNGENSIRVDASGNVLFLERAGSGGLPTPNGFDHTLGGPSDLYLAMIAPDGSSLLFATYLGGSDDEFTETHGLALDAAGNAYVALTTASPDFPTTTGAYQRSYGGSGGSGTGTGTNYPFDGAVVKISPAGALLAGTYLGGRYGEGAEGIGVDAQGNVYVTGATFSDNFPVTTSAFHNRGGGADVFATELAADFGSLVFSEKVGGGGNDFGRAVHVDGIGNMFLVGEASSANLPTLNPLQGGFGGVTDAILVKLVHTN